MSPSPLTYPAKWLKGSLLPIFQAIGVKAILQLPARPSEGFGWSRAAPQCSPFPRRSYLRRPTTSSIPSTLTLPDYTCSRPSILVLINGFGGRQSKNQHGFPYRAGVFASTVTSRPKAARRQHQVAGCWRVANAAIQRASPAATSRKAPSAASRCSMISCCSTSGGGRSSRLSRLSSLSQKMSRLALSRATNSS